MEGWKVSQTPVFLHSILLHLSMPVSSLALWLVFTGFIFDKQSKTFGGNLYFQSETGLLHHFSLYSHFFTGSLSFHADSLSKSKTIAAHLFHTFQLWEHRSIFCVQKPQFVQFVFDSESNNTQRYEPELSKNGFQMMVYYGSTQDSETHRVNKGQLIDCVTDDGN